MNLLNWIDTLFFGYRRIYAAGVEMPERPAVNISGPGVVVSDDAGNNWTNITIAPGSFDKMSPIVTSGSGTYQASAREFVRCNTAGPCAVALPTAVGCAGQEILIKALADDEGEADITITPVSGQTIDGSTSTTVGG